MNGSMVRWLLPNDQWIEKQVGDISEFLLLLRLVNVVSYEAMSYKIARIEMVLDDPIWISVILE
ncbi:hypothetical protein SK3146_04739 [Paenibacillus konkukensis]|uniref:Uncharacterized protein n=2 Tax=Paenibacillus konkukensis TaxID=2020716 RepID=A0ABY4RUG9_9BACL|nr:hypothetical protein [Paenibacillus doosanensis]UQZ85450.1 hypothetical protein SK3146_04739 [Paenibacillus konkukensis]